MVEKPDQTDDSIHPRGLDRLIDALLAAHHFEHLIDSLACGQPMLVDAPVTTIDLFVMPCVPRDENVRCPL